MEGNTSLNKPLIDQETATALQQYAQMQSQRGAQRLQEALNRQGQIGEGSDILGLGSSTAFMTAKSLIESPTVQTGLGYAKNYISDVDKGGFDFATNNLKATLKTKLNEAIQNKKAQLQQKLNDKIENVKDDVNSRVQNAQNEIENQVDDLTTRANNAVNEGVNTVNNAVSDANNAVSDGVDAVNGAVSDANDAVSDAVNTGNRALSDGLETSDVVNGINQNAHFLPSENAGLGDAVNLNLESAFTRATQTGNDVIGNLSESSQNLTSAVNNIFNSTGEQLSNMAESSNVGFNNFFSNLFKPTPAKPDPIDDEFDTDSLIGQSTNTEPVVSSSAAGSEATIAGTAADAGEGLGDAGILDLIGGLADASGVGLAVGLPLTLAGLGFSAYEGLKDLFGDDDSTPFNPDQNEGEVIQYDS